MVEWSGEYVMYKLRMLCINSCTMQKVIVDVSQAIQVVTSQ